MSQPLLTDPAPDFEEMESVVAGDRAPRRVHLVELLLDVLVMEAIVERWMGVSWIPPESDDLERHGA